MPYYVFRNLFDVDELIVIANCIGSRALAGICELLYYGLGRGSGFPDLLLWKPQSDDDEVKSQKSPSCERGRALCVEVKSQRDTLSDKQRYWMMTLEQLGVEVELLKVLDVGEKSSKRAKTKAKTNTKPIAIMN